jgi:FtsZ-interacting cell division protein ZipA
MTELRWALLILGGLFVAGLAIWEWRKPRGRRAGSYDPEQTVQIIERPRRIEPSMDEYVEVPARAETPLHLPTMHAVEPLRVEVAAESAVDVPGAARLAEAARQRAYDHDHDGQADTVARDDLADTVVDTSAEPDEVHRAPAEPQLVIHWPPEHTDRVLTVRVVNGRGEGLMGANLRFALEAAGMKHGPQNIFHRITTDGRVLASAANLVRPGNFDLAAMDSQEFRGVNVFCILPGALPDETMLDELVSLARHIARRLGAVVQDEIGRPLDSACVREMRDSLRVNSQALGDGSEQ